MNSSKTIEELYALRSIACLSVVLLHAIGAGLQSIPSASISEFNFLFFDSLNMLLYFSTPVFIFISIFLLAYSYRNKPLPENFLKKRGSFIFLPFLFMAFFYSIPYATSTFEWGKKFFLNAAIGDYHGYFILIIFQFYLLYIFLHRFLRGANPKIVVSVALAVNVAYLSVFHFVQPPNIPHSEYIWERFYWVPFLGWIFYFAVGYYCGHYYEAFTAFLKKNKKLILIAPFITSAVVLFLYHSNLLIVHSSKRIDILLHATAVALFIFYVMSHVKTVPSLLVKISNYSFGIYLLHMFYISVVDVVYQAFSLSYGPVYIIFLFVFSTVASMATIYYMKSWKYAVYLVGKLPTSRAKSPKEHWHDGLREAK